MFLFAGIGVLRYIWYPLIRILGGHAGVLMIGYSALTLPLFVVLSPFQVLYSLGITVLAPIMAFVAFVLIITIIFAGFIILSVSVATWLYYRLGGVRVIKWGIYRYSRHPQYLGCYSLLYYPPFTHTPPPALPYLILLFTIIGVALIEEQKLIERYGDEYIEYRKQILFLIPLLGAVKDAILWVPRKLIGKDLPETRVEVVKVLAVYLFIIALLSTPFDLLLYSRFFA